MSGTVTSLATLIYLSEDGGGLEAGLCLSIDRFLDQLLPTVELSTSLSLYRRLKFFTKESNEAGFFWGPVSIKLLKDGLEMFEVRSPILYFLLLVLRILLILPQIVSTKALESPRFFRRKILNSTQPLLRPGSFDACASANES